MKIRRFLTMAIALVLSLSMLAFGQGNTFKRLRYLGGTVASKTKSDNWDNKLTVESTGIRLALKDGGETMIDPKRVTGLSYGQEAHRRVGTMIALGVLLTPLALFGLMHKKRNHFIGIEYTNADDSKGGVLLQADKDDYRGLLMALRASTGAKVAVAPDDRKYVPTGIDVIEVEKDKEKKPNDEKK